MIGRSWNRVPITVLLAIAAWAATPLQAVAQGASSPDAYLIVPSQGIGKVSIGMSEAELYNLLGAPKSTFVQPDKSIVYTFESPTLQLLVTTDQGKVYRVGTQDPKFHTKEGVHVGSSLLELHARMGQPSCAEALPMNPPTTFDAYGAVGFITKGGVVSEISTKQRPFECSD